MTGLQFVFVSVSKSVRCGPPLKSGHMHGPTSQIFPSLIKVLRLSK
jgi:hypothetical protein